jgi:hypothetical protein
MLASFSVVPMGAGEGVKECSKRFQRLTHRIGGTKCESGTKFVHNDSDLPVASSRLEGGRSAKQVNVYWRQMLVLDYYACQASQPSFRH